VPGTGPRRRQAPPGALPALPRSTRDGQTEGCRDSGRAAKVSRRLEDAEAAPQTRRRDPPRKCFAAKKGPDDGMARRPVRPRRRSIRFRIRSVAALYHGNRELDESPPAHCGTDADKTNGKGCNQCGDSPSGSATTRFEQARPVPFDN